MSTAAFYGSICLLAVLLNTYVYGSTYHSCFVCGASQMVIAVGACDLIAVLISVPRTIASLSASLSSHSLTLLIQ
jgi:hypothetical protein